MLKQQYELTADDLEEKDWRGICQTKNGKKLFKQF